MNKYQGTQTEKNLRAAFSAESGVRNRYAFYAAMAQKEGFEQIAALLMKTAENEREHARLWLTELDELDGTAENLRHAADGEQHRLDQQPGRVPAQAGDAADEPQQPGK